MSEEIDGHPRSYHTNHLTDGEQRYYRTLRGSRPHVETAVDALRAEAARVGTHLIWRRRLQDNGEGYCRVITAEPLSDEFWVKLGCWDTSGTGYTQP